MPYIQINLETIKYNIASLKNISCTLENSYSTVNRIKNSIDTEVSSRRQIRENILKINSTITELNLKLSKLSSVLGSSELYLDTDNLLLNYITNKVQITNFEKSLGNSTGAIIANNNQVLSSQNVTLYDQIDSGAIIVDSDTLRSKSSIWGLVTGFYEFAKRGVATYTQGWGLSIRNGYVYIKGARKNFALNEGIKGTRYALKNLNNFPELAKFIKPTAAIKDAFKGKSGLLNFIGVGLDIYDDTKKNLRLFSSGQIDQSKIVTDIAVDVTFGLGGIAASAAAGAATGALIGTISPIPIVGTVVGAAVGVVVGVGYTLLTEGAPINGKSLKDHAKDKIQSIYTQTSKLIYKHIQSQTSILTPP